MKKIILGLLALFFSFALNAQNSPVYTVNTTGPNVCDGSAYIDSTQFQSWEWNYYTADSTVMTQTGGYLSGLCPGTYTVTIMDNGLATTYTFDIGAGNGSGCSSLYAYFSNVTQPTGPQSFDGILEVTATGGLAPYTYTWSNGDNSNMIVYLNPGYYSVGVTDANGCYTETSTYLSVDSTNLPCNGFYATVSATNTSSPSVCDATVTITPIGGTAPYTFIENNTTNTNGILTNMCSGVYYTVVTDAAGCSFTTQYYVGSNIDSTNYPLNVYAYTTNVSAEGQCDGTVYLETYGGTAPYTYYDENGLVTSQYITGLCEGVYASIVTDAAGNTYTVNYFIASPDNVIDNGGYDDSTFVTVDTLMNNTLENCIIDYLSLDTAYISNVSFVTADSILVTWSIIDGNGTIEIIESYNISGYGIYELILQIFCPQRATDKYLIVKQELLLNGSQNSIKENSTDAVSVYPNPVNDVLTIDLGQTETNTISVTDITGKIVYRNITQTDLVTINFVDFAKGQYVLTIENTTGVSTHKLVK